MTPNPDAAPLVVRFRGVRGSLPAPSAENLRYGGNTSCLEVRCGDQLLILDAGSGLRLLGEDLVRISGSSPVEATLLLSHTHWDHIQGLPFFAPGYAEHNHVALFAAHGRASDFQRALVNQMTPPHFPVAFKQMRGLSSVEELAQQETKFGNFLIRTAELNHPGGCTGFRIETAAGSLAYLPDHEPYRTGNDRSSDTHSAHRALVEFLRNLDVLILDTQYTTEEYTNRIGWGHGCLAASVQLAIEAGVPGLILFHHDPSHSDEKIDRMVEAARTLASGFDLTIDAAA